MQTFAHMCPSGEPWLPRNDCSPSTKSFSFQNDKIWPFPIMHSVAIHVAAEVRRHVAWSRKDVWIACALACFSVLYLWPFRAAFTNPNPDEGIVLQGAVRVLQGQVPYRDFFSFYAPGSFYWNALLMKLFGDTALVPRTALLGYGALFSLLTFVLARRLASRRGAVLVTLLLLACGLPVAFIVIHNWDSTVAALIALYCVVLLLERPRSWLAAVAGLSVGIAILFNQARGAGLLFGLVLGLLILRTLLARKDLEAKYFAWLIGGALAPLVITAVLFAGAGAWNQMVACLMWPFRHYSAVNHLPYGFVTMPIDDWVHLLASPVPQRTIYFMVLSLIWLICALPIFVVLVAGANLFQLRRDLAPEHIGIVVLCGAVTLGSVLSVQATRPDFYHITFISPLYFFLLPWIFTEWIRPFSSLRKIGPLAMVYLLVTAAAYGMTLFWLARNSAYRQQTRRGEIRILQPNQTIPFIEANFPAGSALLIHPYLPLYSFLTRTITPLPYDFFQPGMHSRQQFQEGADRLAELKPPAVLFQPDFTLVIPSAWPRTPPAALNDPIADYIVRNYKVCKRLDSATPTSFLFMVRKDLRCGSYKLE